MPDMIAKKEFRYDGKTRILGDVFYVKDKDVKLLLAIGRVSRIADGNVLHKKEIVEPVKKVEKVVIQETMWDKSDDSRVEEKTEEKVIEKEETGDIVQDRYQELKSLRDKAISLGMKIDYRWSIARLEREIAIHSRGAMTTHTYHRTDMRAEDE